MKAYLLAGISALLCGIVNYLVADLSERLGMYTLYI
jgi:drug/metabolite transporter (DMT)-like permease